MRRKTLQRLTGAALSAVMLTSIDARADYSVKPVNAAVAQSLAQSNAFDLNVGIQDFPGQLFVVLTNLTDGARDLMARSRSDAEYRQFLQTVIIDPLEKVRDDLRTAADDSTRAGLNFNTQKVVNDIINQFKRTYELIYEQVTFRDTAFTRGKFLNVPAKREFDALYRQLGLVIYLHEAAVRAAG